MWLASANGLHPAEGILRLAPLDGGDGIVQLLGQLADLKAVDHVNNAPRKNLDGKTPYEKAHWLYGKETLEKLQLRYVAPDEVTLTPKLLKK